MKRLSKLTLFAWAVGLLLALGSTAVAGETIVMGDFSWDSVQVHNRIAGFILEHGYGFNVEYEFGESIPILLGLRRGDVDATTEAWVDNYLDVVLEATRSGDVISVGINYPDAPQGWYVPTYVMEGDEERGIEPLAPGLTSVFDLPEYVELFQDPEDPGKGRFYNAPTGWVIHDIHLDKLEAYGLNEYFNAFDPGSDAGLSAAIVSAYERGEAIVAYSWEPNWVVGMMDMTMLEEPDFDQDVWDDNHGCVTPPVRVNILVNAELASRAPQAVDLLANYETELDHTNAFLAYMQQEDASVDEAAVWFLRNYADVWHDWTLDADVINQVTAALEDL